MDFSAEPLFLDPPSPDYAAWLSDLKPRTCLLMHWLAALGAVREPGAAVRLRAHQFAAKRRLLGRLVDATNHPASDKTQWLLQNGEFDLYVAWLMWLRFQEYVPARFVLPAGRERVLIWVRGQLRRPELSDAETLGELQWQVERIAKQWHETEH
ncbi:MAG TPA: hypothetical protein VF627_12335 [Abditibacterium sp.]